MNIPIAILTVSAVLAAGSAQAATLEIKDAVARVTIVPEDRADIKVEIVAPNARLPLTVSTSGDRTVVDGDLTRGVGDCHGSGESFRVRVRRVGQIGWAEMPQVVVHTPRAVVVSTNGAVQGMVGRSASLDLHNSGCSAWTIADVAGDVDIRESGAGSIHMGAADRLGVSVSGASNIHATRIRKGLDAGLSGAGNVRVDELAGTLEARVSGVGQVHVADGRVTLMHASVSGIGSVDFGGVADRLDASISGLGGIRVGEVIGTVSKSVSGGGSVRIGRPAT